MSYEQFDSLPSWKVIAAGGVMGEDEMPKLPKLTVQTLQSSWKAGLSVLQNCLTLPDTISIYFYLDYWISMDFYLLYVIWDLLLRGLG